MQRQLTPHGKHASSDWRLALERRLGTGEAANGGVAAALSHLDDEGALAVLIMLARREARRQRAWIPVRVGLLLLGILVSAPFAILLWPLLIKPVRQHRSLRWHFLSEGIAPYLERRQHLTDLLDLAIAWEGLVRPELETKLYHQLTRLLSQLSDDEAKTLSEPHRAFLRRSFRARPARGASFLIAALLALQSAGDPAVSRLVRYCRRRFHRDPRLVDVVQELGRTG